MAASTITRPTLTDDTGDLTSGDIINAAFFGANVYDVIDGLFTRQSSVYEGSTDGVRDLRVRNTHTGTSAAAAVYLGNNSSETRSFLAIYGTNVGTSGVRLGDGVLLQSDGVGGIAMAANNAAGAIRFATGGGVEVGGFIDDGHFRLMERTTDPGTGDLTSLGALAIYMKNDKLVFAYNNGGTITYVSLALNGSSTTWVHNTTAP